MFSWNPKFAGHKCPPARQTLRFTKHDACMPALSTKFCCHKYPMKGKPFNWTSMIPACLQSKAMTCWPIVHPGRQAFQLEKSTYMKSFDWKCWFPSNQLTSNPSWTIWSKFCLKQIWGNLIALPYLSGYVTFKSSHNQRFTQVCDTLPKVSKFYSLDNTILGWIGKRLCTLSS